MSEETQEVIETSETVKETTETTNKSFVDSFIKGKGALADADTFTILQGKSCVEVVIGY